jgi:hypothetical protein
MEKIYLIEDINDLKYVGRTKQKYLCDRLASHRHDKKKYYGQCSSSKLNLWNCNISVLEECSTEDAREREIFWIHKIDCVNVRIDNNKTENISYDKSQDRWQYQKMINRKRHTKYFSTEEEAIQYKMIQEEA